MAETQLLDSGERDGWSQFDDRPSWPPSREAQTDLLVIGVVTIILGWMAGPLGIVAGILLAGLWTVLPNVVVFAAGQVVVIALVPGEPIAVTNLLPVVILGGLLITTGVSDTRVRDGTLMLGIWIAIGGVIGAVYLWTETLWVTAVGLLAIAMAGFISLAIHSYRQVGDEHE
ncbi:hypothetical protein [Halosimplex halobium]|uniref:hypothetical protein n=1 Tax=Halosimplex halobium TaxID=3396618 RepID=UPI003F57563D